jgi:hypothetical protein
MSITHAPSRVGPSASQGGVHSDAGTFRDGGQRVFGDSHTDGVAQTPRWGRQPVEEPMDAAGPDPLVMPV